MTTKQISRMVILTAVIVSLVVLLVKLIQGTAGIVGSLFNTVAFAGVRWYSLGIIQYR